MQDACTGTVQAVRLRHVKGAEPAFAGKVKREVR